MNMPETQQAVLSELGAWENIIHSEDWIAYRRLLKAHVEHLQKEVNTHVRLHEDRKAGEALRGLDDCKKILDLVDMRISELRRLSETK